MAKQVYITPTKVYGSLQELAEEFGVTMGAVSRAVSEKAEFRGVPVRCSQRILLCELKKGGWIVGVFDSSNRRVVPMDQGKKVPLTDIAGMRDISIGWYFGKLFKSGTEFAGQRDF